MKKFFAILFCGLFMMNSANAEIRTYEGFGEYVMSDFETPDIAKQRAKQRAEAAAQEKAGVFVKSHTHVVNAVLESEEIDVITGGVMKVNSVSYDVRPDGQAGFIFSAKVTVDIDTDKIDEWLKKGEAEKANLIEQNEALKRSMAEQEKQLNALKTKLAEMENNQSEISSAAERYKITREFYQTDNAFMSNQFLKEGHENYNRGNFRGAISSYTEAIALNPQNATAYSSRGSAFGMLQDYSSAAADYLRSVQIDNSEANSYIGLGVAEYYLKNYQDAISALTNALQLNPRSGHAYYARGVCYASLGMYYEAYQDYQTAKQFGYAN